MRYLALLTILFAACGGDIGENVDGTVDARPIDYRDPPDDPKEGSGTAEGCDGVTARGECDQGSAVYCDLDRGRIRKVDCQALGQNCILDTARGAVCKKLEEDPGGGSSACTDTGISETGFCTAAGEAVYCDTSGDTPVTRTWNCGDVNKTCAVGDCATGAFCCGGETPTEVDCPATGYDFDGVCEGEVAKWCSPTTGLHEKNCSDLGQRCEVDTCATGAYCCGEATGSTPEAECAQLGYDGICKDNLTVRFCFNDEILEATCSGTKTCQENACMSGAGCCEPPAASECTTIGYDGVCKDENTVRFCAGDTDAEIEEITCDTGETCQVDEDGFAECAEVVDPCANLGPVGECVGDTLRYCLTSSGLTETDCTTTNQTCQVDTCFSGFASCCD